MGGEHVVIPPRNLRWRYRPSVLEDLFVVGRVLSRIGETSKTHTRKGGKRSDPTVVLVRKGICSQRHEHPPSLSWLKPTSYHHDPGLAALGGPHQAGSYDLDLHDLCVCVRVS